ncbi:patatin-like phospholipase family protein [Clostridium algidicarnis]|uniref:patatin-like phospholipase family protein n=1 Tax=Clostridium algidicarnis TaxID=37659 RepID=UPI001C0D6418|nr:patatin-like phospholipase family protein [Clostridium algidicarnis]MBU3197224.1 patatin-like phospholipase family protein [Clostridium algidicarnis]
MKVDMVFEGGGVLGISFIGALASLKEHGYEIQRCAGTSAGAIMAALVVAGYNEDELYKLMKELDYSLMKKSNSYEKFLPLKLIKLFNKKGLYDGDNIEKFIAPLLEAKGVTKFKHVMKNGKSKLKIIASDITRREIIVFPDDLSKYNIDKGEFEIAKAVRMSASIPLYFTPYVLKGDTCPSFIVDGGLLSNFPIWIFDVEGIPRWPTFGLKLQDKDSRTSTGHCNFIGFVQDVVQAPLYVDGERFIRDKDLVRTVIIESKGMKSTDFDIASKNAKTLYDKGYRDTEKFLNKWDFKRYVADNRMDKGNYNVAKR